MTIGIYSLYWEQQDLVYIGKSQKIEQDFKNRHCKKAYLGKHSNYKVQQAYDKFGTPALTILECCEISQLSHLEILWTNEFDSLNPKYGLNIVEPGDGVGRGIHSANSRHSKFLILKIFSLLYKNILSYTEISARLGVKRSTICHISSSDSHLWLKEKYPVQYALMKQRTTKLGNTRKARFMKVDLVSPEGIVYTEITNLAEFCRGIPLLSKNIDNARKGLSLVILGKRRSYFGWTVK